MTKLLLITAIFATIMGSINVNSQQMGTAIEFNEIVNNIEIKERYSYTQVSELFKSIERAVAKTDSVIAFIGRMETSNLDSVKKAIDILTNEVLSAYISINRNDTTNSRLLKDFKEVVLENTYALDDLIRGVSQDLARHQNEKARLLRKEPRSKTDNMKIGYEEKIIEQLKLQLEYLKAAEKKLFKIQSQASITEEDIDFFLAACKKNEEFLRYSIQTLRIYRDVEQFLKDANSLSSIKEISKTMYLSLNELHEQIIDFIQDRLDEFDKEYNEFPDEFQKEEGR